MMNQYYGFGGRSGRSDYDRAPYRRPVNRGMLSGNMPSCSTGRNFLSSPTNGSCLSSNSDPHRRSGCGCNGGKVPDTASCDRLMDRIRAVDFALYETILYLDVYPNSCDALETYHKLKAQSEALHTEYEATRAPLTAFGNKSDTSWDWMSKPFPWEYDAD